VSHNQIDHTPYTAISQGWGGWPDKEKQSATANFSHDNAIANNLIFSIMTVLNDGGGIYTQGITGSSLATGEKVTGNLIHDQVGKGHVIYTDNGCTFETITGNAVYNNPTAQAWASRHNDYRPGHTTTYDPTDVENNYFQNQAGYTTGGGVTVANNTTITGASGVPASIANNAGLEPAYQGLLNWTQAPLPPVGGGGTDFGLSVSPATQTVAAGATAAYTVHTSVVSGSPDPITLTASGLPTGATATFSPNPVTPGTDATLTVATSASDPGGTSSITVTASDSAATHTASADLTVTGPGGGLVLSNLVVADSANAANWSLQSNLQVGATVNGDRTYTFSALPAALVGAHWVRTANASKTVTANPLVTFTVSQAATVYVGVDSRSGKRPWMDATWVDTGTTLTTNENGTARTYQVFRKSFAAGQVALGPNAANTNMYTIGVV
jgi:hypothetical protein